MQCWMEVDQNCGASPANSAGTTIVHLEGTGLYVASKLAFRLLLHLSE